MLCSWSRWPSARHPSRRRPASPYDRDHCHGDLRSRDGVLDRSSWSQPSDQYRARLPFERHDSRRRHVADRGHRPRSRVASDEGRCSTVGAQLCPCVCGRDARRVVRESRQERRLGHGASRSRVAADRSRSKALRRGVAPHRTVVSPGDGFRPDRGAIGHADVHGRISRSDDMAATVAVPCMWSKFFGPGAYWAYWSERCAFCGSRRPRSGDVRSGDRTR